MNKAKRGRRLKGTTYPWGELDGLLRARQLTQRQFAREVGVSPQTVTRWLDRDDRPGDDHMNMIALVLAQGDVPVATGYRTMLWASLVPAREAGETT